MRPWTDRHLCEFSSFTFLLHFSFFEVIQAIKLEESSFLQSLPSVKCHLHWTDGVFLAHFYTLFAASLCLNCYVENPKRTHVCFANWECSLLTKKRRGQTRPWTWQVKKAKRDETLFRSRRVEVGCVSGWRTVQSDCSLLCSVPRKFKLRYKDIYHGNLLKGQLAFTIHQDCLLWGNVSRNKEL